MLLVLIRLILVIVPVLAVIYWLRWRMKKDRSDEELAEDIKDLRRTLIIAVVVMLGSVLALYFLDDRKGEARMKYIPPHEVDGKVVPGRFVPADKDEDQTDDGDQTEDGGMIEDRGEPEDKDGRGQD